MGMDLYSKRKPRNKPSLYYRFNWTGWSNLLDFLGQVGADLTEFAGSNDGDVVSPESCIQVADSIEDAFESGNVYTSYKISKYDSTGVDAHFFVQDKLVVSCEVPEHVDRWIVNFKTKKVYEPTSNPIPETLKKLLEMDEKDLPTEIGRYSEDQLKRLKFFYEDHPLELEILETRLLGKEPEITPKIDWENWRDPNIGWNRLGYYLGFAEFCRGCGKLGGFQQC